MKNTNFMTAKTLFMVIIFAFGMIKANSQPSLNAPSYSDTLLHSGDGVLNNASITTATGGTLRAIVWDDGGGQYHICVSDGSFVSPYYNSFDGFTPDVIIGDDLLAVGTPGTKYCIIVVYALPTVACGSDYDINIDVFHATGVGSSMSIGGRTTYTISHNGTASPSPHIDVMADYDPFVTTGTPLGGSTLPLCEQFVICYVDANSTLPGGCGGSPNPFFGVNLYNATLSSPNSGTTNTDQNCVNRSIVPVYSDVAAVEQYGSSYYMVAHFTYIDANNDLYQNYYYYVGSPAFANSNYVPIANNADLPRIDGIDDPNYSTLYNTSWWEIVFNDLTTTKLQANFIDAVNNTPSSPICMSGWNTIDDFYPVVCSGPGLDYTGGYFHANNIGGNSGLFVTQIAQLGNGDFTLSSNFWQVNLASIVYNNSDWHEALSSTCNNNGTIAGTPFLFACWNNNGTIYFKGVTSIGAFKTAPEEEVGSINISDDWKLSPNPASDYTMLMRPVSHKDAFTYSVTDLSGRTLLKGITTELNTKIDISSLSPAMYLMHVYENNNKGVEKVKRFLKQ